MFFEILLLSTIVVTGYLGPMILRRLPPGRRWYGVLLCGDLALSIVAFAARRTEGPSTTGDLLGVIAIGAGVCLIMVPPVLRDLARRALIADRLRIAIFFIDLRELLQPGMGARQERELVEAIFAVRSGRVDDAVDVLRDTRDALADPLAKRQIDERIVLTYLSARRWDGAISHFEGSLDDEGKPMSPQLLVEMVRAYCEAGRLEDAAGLVSQIEGSAAAREPLLGFLVNRARLVFLAFVGRTSAVEGIVGSNGPLHMLPPASRHFWSGIARLNAGDRSGARTSLEEAARLSRRDPRAREVAQTTLESINTPGVAGPHEIPPMVAELADRVAGLAAQAKPPVPSTTPKLAGVTWRNVPATVALVAANVAVTCIIAFSYGTTGDMGALVRAGANVKSAVAVGEWWRLPSSVFVHVGLLHLALNMFGLWVLGKLVEQMFGSARFFAIYMLSGIGGALASYYVSGPGMSMGASGAVLGIMGAAVAELGVYRKSYPARWRNGLLGMLVFITVAQIAIGFAYPAIDQSAHVGGFLCGAAIALLLSSKLSVAGSSTVRAIAGTLVIISAASLAYAAHGVVTTDYGDTLRKHPIVEHTIDGLRIRAPGNFRLEDGELVDPSPFFALIVGREAGDLGDALAAMIRSEEDRAGDRNFEHSRRAVQNTLVLPEPWQSRELIVSYDGIGGSQYFRVAVFGRVAGDELWVGRLILPNALTGSVAPVIAEILESVEAVGPARQ